MVCMRRALGIGIGLLLVAAIAWAMWPRAVELRADLRSVSDGVSDVNAVTEPGQVTVTETHIRAEAVVATRAANDSEFAQVRGRCLAAEDGQPLAGCTVVLRSQRQTTGADGRFALAVVPGERLELSIEAQDRVPRAGTWTSPLASGQIEDIGDVLLPRGFRVRGRVVDAAGVGVGGVSAEVSGLDVSMLPGVIDEQTVSGPCAIDGTFVVETLLPSGDWKIEVRDVAAHSEPLAFHVDARLGCEPLTIVAERTPPISGIVVDDGGVAVAGVHLATETGGAESHTDDSGRFRLVATQVSGGTATRVLLRDPGPCEPDFVPPVVAWGTKDLRLVLRRGVPPTRAALTIEVRDDVGAPVEEFAIVMPSASERWFGHPTHAGTHARGILIIDSVPRGRHTLRVLPAAPELLAGEPQTIDVEAAALSASVVLARLHTCMVEVVTSDGAPVCGSSVELVRVGHDREAAKVEGQDPRRGFLLLPGLRRAELIGKAATDQSGRADILAPLDLRCCLLRVIGEHLPEYVYEPPLSPTTALRIVVGAGGSLHGTVALHGQSRELLALRVLAAGGAVVCGDEERPLAPQPDGTFKVERLAPGRYRVLVVRQVSWTNLNGSVTVASVPLLRSARDVEINTGETTQVELDPGQDLPGSLHGRVYIVGREPRDWLLSLCRVDTEAAHGAFRLAADGSYAANELLPGRYRAAFMRASTRDDQPLAQVGEVFEVVAGGEGTRDFALTPRKLVLHPRNTDGSVHDGAVIVRCGAMRRGAPSAAEVVLDPAPDQPVQLRAVGGSAWSEPVTMPQDKTEFSADVIVPGMKSH
jgi:hypothetical protein